MPSTLGEWVRYWHNDVGVNIIPADTQKKRTSIRWSDYQDSAISDEQVKAWLASGTFNLGAAIITGKIWRGKYSGCYLNAIDCDNQLAIDEMLTRNGKTTTLQRMAEHLIIEQHPSNLNKAHIYVISQVSFPLKASSMAEFSKEIKENSLPSFEVKGDAHHGIMYCTPSIHKNGDRYAIIGTLTPKVLSEDEGYEFIHHLETICQKYGIDYLEKEPNDTLTKRMIFDETFQVFAGHNRHVAMLGVMESVIAYFNKILSEKEIRELCDKVNQRKCNPPLSVSEMDKQWKDAVKFMSKMVD